MEEYYQKVIQLQEKLRHSEEERLKLEMKFNEVLQEVKEEAEGHLKKMRSKYKQFLDEDRRRQQRNDKILEALDRIENRSQIWEAKTERFKQFRKKYHDYLGRRSRSPEKTPEPRQEERYEPRHEPKHEQRHEPYEQPADVKSDIMEKYLQSLSSQKCKDDLLQKRPPPESKYSNLGNINSVYWAPPKTEKIDQEKLDSTQLKNNKDMENALKQNSAPYDFERKYLDKSYDSFNEPRRTSQQFADDPKIQGSIHVHNELESLLKQHKDEVAAGAKEQMPRKSIQEVSNPLSINRSFGRPVESDLERESTIQVHKEPPNQIRRDLSSHIQKEPPTQVAPNPIQREPLTQIQRQPSEALRSDFDQVQPLARKEVPMVVERQNLEMKPKPTVVEKVEDILHGPAKIDQCNVAEPQNDIGGFGTKAEPFEESTNQYYDESAEPLAQPEPIQSPQQYDANGQLLAKYNDNGQPLPQYDENGQPLAKYDENRQPLSETGQPLPQYDKTGQPLQPYNEGGHEQSQYYDETGQPLEKYDEHGQQYYDNTGQDQYDENGQPITQYDENGQPIIPYDPNTQIQYDEKGHPIVQYDENGQPIIQYDENGQPLLQYDANGQALGQYDENGQPLGGQYDENGQPLTQYDKNGQPLGSQYDETGQPLGQYDEHGQPLGQYDENGQPIGGQYDETGQPLGQYDENGQPLGQYDENGQLLQQYYDESGQPIQYYGEGEPAQQYDENGLPYGDGQQYYADPTQQPEDVQLPEVGVKSNVLEMLETDTESTKQDTKISNESDFDFSNG